METTTTRLNALGGTEIIQAFRNTRNAVPDVDTQPVLLVDQFGNPIGAATQGTHAAVTLTGGQRQADGAAEVVLIANPRRLGFRIRSKRGTAFLGFDDQVDLDSGMPVLATESVQMSGPGVYTGIIYAADDGVNAVDLRVWEWSNP